MTIQFSEEQALLLESANSFCRDHSSIESVRRLLHTTDGYDASLWKQIVDLGWPAIGVAEQYGGSDIHINCAIPVLETMGKQLMASPLYSNLLVSQLLTKGATESQKQRFLPKLISGNIGSVAILENNDWGKPSTDTQLSQSADGYHLNGAKLLVEYGQQADFYLVYAHHQTVNQSEHRQPCWVIVPADKTTIDIEPHHIIDETKRAAQLTFNHIGIDQDCILPLDNAAALYREAMLLGALFTSAEATGSSSSALNSIVEYLQTRTQFGRKIGSYQSLKHPTVDILLGYNDCRSLIYAAASLLDDNWLSVEAEKLCRMAKIRATQTLTFAGDRAVQFHGGMGFSYECDAQLYIRKAQWVQQQYGDDIHHNKRLANLLF